MKRKTNLFYTEGPDSKFITFSNYAESLTGNFLSTDTKIYPSRFIALYIAGLNKETKPLLIKYIAKYYENKLAVLRDYFSKNRGDIEKNVSPLNYLLECLLMINSLERNPKTNEYELKYRHFVWDGDTYDQRLYNPDVNIDDDQYRINDVITFKYISDITEQDYNGTFADTICNIDLNYFHNISYIDVTKNPQDNVVDFDFNLSLYGWDMSIPEAYKNDISIPDSINGFDLDSEISIPDTITEDTEIMLVNDPTNGKIYHHASEYISYHNTPKEDNSQTVHIKGDNDIENINIADETRRITGLYEKSEYNSQYVFEIPWNYIPGETIEDKITSLEEIIANDEQYTGVYIEDNPPETEPVDTPYSDLVGQNGYILFIVTGNQDDVADELLVYDGADITQVSYDKFQYNIDSSLVKLAIENVTNKTSLNDVDGKISDSLEFNCIIPLYDIVDINYKSNFNSIDDIDEIDLTPSASNNMYITNVPLGMWFYTDGEAHTRDSYTTEVTDDNGVVVTDPETGNPMTEEHIVETNSITLYKDLESNFSQTWSLTISSQFKPFPYSTNMQNDMLSNNNTNAFTTFSQVLASQASMMNTFNKLLQNFEKLNEHVKHIESQLSNIGTSYNIDNIHREFNNYEIEMNKKFNDLKDDVIDQLSYIRWHVTI